MHIPNLDGIGLRLPLPGQCINCLPRREIQPQHLPGPVNELTGRKILRTANDLGPQPRLHQQKLRGPAGQVPCQEPLFHELHMSAAPKHRRQMALLMGKSVVSTPHSSGHTLSCAAARQKAWHVRALNGPWALAGSHCTGHFGQGIRQLLRQLRQTHHMLKQGVRLPKPQSAGFYRQEPPGIFSLLSVKPRHGCRVVAGVDPQCDHSLERAKEPRMPLIKETLSSSS